MPQLKTAKDLPAGATVEHAGIRYTKMHNDTFPWIDDAQAKVWSDERIVHLIDDGGILTHIPAGISKRQGW